MGTPFQNVKQAGIPLVPYAQAIEQVQDADLFFCCGTDPAAALIHVVTGSPISHTGFLFRDGANIRTIESTFTEGVHIGDGEAYLRMGDGACIIARLSGITPGAADAVLASAKSLIGRHYEVAEEVAMALHALLPLIRIRPDFKEFYCSGLVQEALEGTEWAIPYDKSGGNATPIDVYAQPFVLPLLAVAN